MDEYEWRLGLAGVVKSFILAKLGALAAAGSAANDVGVHAVFPDPLVLAAGKIAVVVPSSLLFGGEGSN